MSNSSLYRDTKLGDHRVKILSLDPGGTTGWAVWNGEYLVPGPKGFNSGQIGPHEHHLDLYNFLCFEQTHDFVVVCESFEYRNEQRVNVELISREYIGVAKLFTAERQRGKKLILQTAGKVKPFWSDDKLRKLGLWSVGRKHANDAMRHLLHYMVFELERTDILRMLK